MDRNPYHGNNHQQGNAPYSWPQPNGMAPPYRPPESADPSANTHSSRMPNGHMYYGQAQADQNTAAPLYAGASAQPYQQPAYADNRTSQYGQQNMNPWGQYSQGQPYNTTATNTALPPPPPGQSYNQYMYLPPPSQTTTSMPNHNQGQAIPYSPPVHSYYQMQQPPTNYYYPPNQMYPNAVPPPPLPQQPPLPPSSPSTANKGQTNTAPNASSRENIPTSRPDDNKFAKSSSLTDNVASTSSRDRKTSAQADDKEKDDKDTKKAVPIMVGKRRGGRVLPTGVVKKQKVEDGNSKGKSDAWSQYMEEVRRYKDQSCTEERQNRPLVK